MPTLTGTTFSAHKNIELVAFIFGKFQYARETPKVLYLNDMIQKQFIPTWTTVVASSLIRIPFYSVSVSFLSNSVVYKQASVYKISNFAALNPSLSIAPANQFMFFYDFRPVIQVAQNFTPTRLNIFSNTQKIFSLFSTQFMVNYTTVIRQSYSIRTVNKEQILALTSNSVKNKLLSTTSPASYAFWS